MCYSMAIPKDLNTLSIAYGAKIVGGDEKAYRKIAAEDPKHFPNLAQRIYPGGFAPVIYEDKGATVISLMRYGAYPPPAIQTPGRYTTYNARKDNLQSPFWSRAFKRHHGFVVMSGFYEWVAVKDLLKTGQVSLTEIERQFKAQSDARKERIIESGKPYKPTRTELTDPRFRRIVIHFHPDADQPLLVPVIFSKKPGVSEPFNQGFAVITDDPPQDISAAGHDRCPIFLYPHVLKEWMEPEGKSPEELLKLLSMKGQTRFKHELETAA